MGPLDSAVHYVLDLGAPVMMPVIMTLLGLALGQGFSKSFRAGLTVGVGFVAVGPAVGLLVQVVGPRAMAFAEVLGLKLDVLDVGGPMGAAVSSPSPIAGALTPGSLGLGCAGARVTAFVVFKLADWTAPAVEHYFGLEGISLPHTETVNWAPLMYALDRIERHIPGLSRLHADPASVRKRLGMLGEPILMGALLGLLLGVLGAIPDFRAGAFGKAVKDVLTLAVSMAAALIIRPKVV